MFICFATHYTDVKVAVKHVILVMFLSLSTCRAYISGKDLGIATHVCVSAIDVMFPSPIGFHGHDNSESKGQSWTTQRT